MAELEVTEVGKAFGGRTVLRRVDLRVPDGSTLSLLGASGSGKSTILRIIAGLEAPDAGGVLLGGTDLAPTPAHRRGVGIVFQDHALFPHLDVAGNVAFGLRMAGEPKAAQRDRVGEVLALVGLDGYGPRDPMTLSGGEAQRVALARALAPAPGVLLLDEPLAGIDQELRERLLVDLRTLFARTGLTVVVVTHDPAEATTLGDQVAVLVDGTIARSGSPSDCVGDPRTATVARLLGHRNVLAAAPGAAGVETAIGPFPSAAGSSAVLVPADAIEVDASGELAAVVRARIFRGGRAALVVDAGSPAVRLEVGDAPVEPGATVRLAIDRLRAVPLAD